MNNEKISLCIPYFNSDEKRVSHMHRIADFVFEKQQYSKVKYSEDYEDTERRVIYAKSNEADLNIARVYRWYVNEKNMVISSRTDNEVMEVFFIDQYNYTKHKSDIEVRRLLHNGLFLNKYISDNFLLVINEDINHYEVLKFKKRMSCASDKNMFKIEKSCQDMLRTTHKVELISISKNDIFDTKESDIHSGKYDNITTRYFYKCLDLPRATRMFELREPQDYAKAFVSKYIKTKQEILGATTKDRQRLAQIIDTALNDKLEISSFFKETGYSLQDVKYSLLNLNSDTLSLLVNNDKFSEIIEDALFRNELLRTDFINIAKSIWLNETDNIRLEIERNIESLKESAETAHAECEDLLIIKNELEGTIKELNLTINSKEQELSDVKGNLSEINSKIQAELEKFQNDVVHLAAMTAFSKAQTIPKIVKSGFIIQNSIKLSDSEDEPANQLSVFAEDLQENLEISGIISDVTAAVSQIIACTLVSGRNLILDANSDNVADAISSLLDGNHVTKIFITDSTVDVQALIENINSISSRTVLIHGLLNTFNERMFVTLSQLCKGKFFIFACEDIDTFDVLPSHWWKHATLLSLRNHITVHTEEDYISYRICETLFENDKDSNLDVEDIKRTISKYIKSNNLPQVQALAIRQLFSISKKHLKNFSIMQKYLLIDETVNIEDFELSEV